MRISSDSIWLWRFGVSVLVGSVSRETELVFRIGIIREAYCLGIYERILP